MRAPLIVGIFACVLLTFTAGTRAQAQTQDLTVSNVASNITTNIFQNSFQATPVNLNITTKLISQSNENVEAPTKQSEAKPKPKVHEVGTNESLTIIAAQYDTTWVRLFNKNEQLADPDILAVGDKLTVPMADEQLPDRPLPQPPVAPAVAPQLIIKASSKGRGQASAVQSRGVTVGSVSASGNTYAPGYCTWYAKNMRPDLPNNLGNANTWVSMAAAQGIATGSTPAAGAIGQQGMHVVFVQSVNEDGTVSVSEMNYVGLFVVSTRTVPASNFQYIY